MEKKHQYQFVGACIVIALAVIFVPMFLSGEANLDRHTQQQTIPIPPVLQLEPIPDALEFVALDEVVGVDTPLDPVVTAEPERLEPEIGAATDSEVVEPAPTVKDDFVVPASTNVKPAADDLAAWVVQVASFRERDKALALRDQLRAKQFSTFVEESAVGSNTVYRVKVGPIIEKREAEQQQALIAKSFALSGMVISYP